MDIRQSNNYGDYMQSLAWLVETAGGGKVFIRHLPLVIYFSVIKVQRPTDIDFEELNSIAKKHHALFVKIEPDINAKYKIADTKFSSDNWPLLPTKTLILNLDLDIKSSPKDTRYEIRKAESLGVAVGKSTDIELFYKLLQETMKIGHWSVPIHKEVVNLWRSFQLNRSQILIAINQNKPVGGCLLIWDGDTAHYMYAALTKEGRKLGAAYVVMWEAIKFCQKRGLKSLDLEGIYDDRFPSHTKNWQGFTKFKMGWGGRIVEYPGSYIKYYNPIAKFLFTVFN